MKLEQLLEDENRKKIFLSILDAADDIVTTSDVNITLSPSYDSIIVNTIGGFVNIHDGTSAHHLKCDNQQFTLAFLDGGLFDYAKGMLINYARPERIFDVLKRPAQDVYLHYCYQHGTPDADDVLELGFNMMSIFDIPSNALPDDKKHEFLKAMVAGKTVRCGIIKGDFKDKPLEHMIHSYQYYSNEYLTISSS